jgi:hypothetical protein
MSRKILVSLITTVGLVVLIFATSILSQNVHTYKYANEYAANLKQFAKGKTNTLNGYDLDNGQYSEKDFK